MQDHLDDLDADLSEALTPQTQPRQPTLHGRLAERDDSDVALALDISKAEIDLREDYARQKALMSAKLEREQLALFIEYKRQERNLTNHFHTKLAELSAMRGRLGQ